MGQGIARNAQGVVVEFCTTVIPLPHPPLQCVYVYHDHAPRSAPHDPRPHGVMGRGEDSTVEGITINMV